MSEVVVKSADEPRSSTTVLAVDSELTLALATGDYWVQIGLRMAAGATPDIKYSLGFTGTLTWANLYDIHRLDQRPENDNLDVNNGTARGYIWTEVNMAAASTNAIAGSNTASTHIGAVISGLIRVSAAGSLRVLWAQNTSSGTAANMLAGSYLEAVPVADMDETVVIKEATETRNSDAVLTDDDELSYALEANKKYIVTVACLLYSTVTPKISLALRITGSPTTVIGTSTRSDTGLITGPLGFGTSQNWGTFWTTPTELLFSGSATTTHRGALTYDLGIIMAGSAGQVSLAWRQNVSDAGNTQVFQGSYLKILEVP